MSIRDLNTGEREAVVALGCLFAFVVGVVAVSAVATVAVSAFVLRAMGVIP